MLNYKHDGVKYKLKKRESDFFDDVNFLFVIPYATRFCENIDLVEMSKIFNDHAAMTAIQSMCPVKFMWAGAKMVESLILSRRYTFTEFDSTTHEWEGPVQGTATGNETETEHGGEAAAKALECQYCYHVSNRYKTEILGVKHVCTVDPNILRDNGWHEKCAASYKHHPYQGEGASDALQAIADTLQDYRTNVIPNKYALRAVKPHYLNKSFRKVWEYLLTTVRECPQWKLYGEYKGFRSGERFKPGFGVRQLASRQY